MLSFGARPWLVAAGVLVLPVTASCQPPAHASLQAEQDVRRLPQFEVAAIRPNRSNDLVRSFWFTPDGVSIKWFPLRDILHILFLGLHEYGDDQVNGEVGWVKTERYDFQAKVGEKEVSRSKKLGVDQQGLALQAPISQRFNLRFHRVAVSC